MLSEHFHRPAIIAPNRTITYRELDGLICNLAYHLKQKGIGKGSKVGFLASNDWQIIALFFALFRLQAIACPLNLYLPNFSEAIDKLSIHEYLEMKELNFDKSPSYDPPELNEQLPATLMFTSGSSGMPKIACHSYANHFYNAKGLVNVMGINSDHSWHLSLPLYHVAGLGILFRCFLSGAAILLPDMPYSEATHLSFVPTQLYRLEEECTATILLGGAPIPSTLMIKALKRKLTVKTSYGLTEMASTVTLDGIPLPYRDIALGPDGEILVKGKTLFLGYYDQSTGLDLELDEHGYFATGDLGIWSSQGLKVIGRKDNLFISGGENIQPEEIEDALLALPGISHAVVLPKEDEEFGARPIAFIHDESGKHTLESLRKSLQTRLPKYKLPIELHPLPDEFRVAKPPRHLLYSHSK